MASKFRLHIQFNWSLNISSSIGFSLPLSHSLKNSLSLSLSLRSAVDKIGKVMHHIFFNCEKSPQLWREHDGLMGGPSLSASLFLSSSLIFILFASIAFIRACLNFCLLLLFYSVIIPLSSHNLSLFIFFLFTFFLLHIPTIFRWVKFSFHLFIILSLSYYPLFVFFNLCLSLFLISCCYILCFFLSLAELTFFQFLLLSFSDRWSHLIEFFLGILVFTFFPKFSREFFFIEDDREFFSIHCDQVFFGCSLKDRKVCPHTKKRRATNFLAFEKELISFNDIFAPIWF